MKFAGKGHDVDFRDFVEMQKDIAGAFLWERLILSTQTSRTASGERGMDSSLHHVSIPGEMRDLMESGLQVLAAGAHGHLICLWMQFPEWYKNLQCLQKEGLNFLEAA